MGKYRFSGVVMPSKDTKKLEFNRYLTPDKIPYITHADVE